MKNAFFALVGAALAFGPVNAVYRCEAAQFSSESRGERDWSWTWEENKLKTRFTVKGELEFNEDYTDLTRISPGGSLVIAEANGKTSRRLEIKPEPDGSLSRKYEVNKQGQPWAGEAKTWLAGLIDKGVNEQGLDAKKRAERIFAKGGFSALQSEISRLGSDFVKGLYLVETIRLPELKEEEIRLALGQAGTEISADFVKAKLLRGVPGRALASQQTADAWLGCAGTIQSDFDLSQTLVFFVAGGQASEKSVIKTLGLAARMGSDFEKSRLLQKVLELTPGDSILSPAFFEAADAINSDFERGRTLQALLKQKDLSAGTLENAAKSARAMHSDFEKQRFLVALAGAQTTNELSASLFLDTIGTMGSDFEKRRGLSAFAKREGLSEKTAVAVLKAAGGIQSDFEKASLLLEFVKSARGSEAIRNQLLAAAKTIGSDYERGRVLAAVYK